MNRRFCRMRVLAAVLLIGLTPALAQTQRNVAHTLFGDLKVVNQAPDSRLPGSFRILLKNLSGHILRRQSIGAGGRYRFLEVPNGEYILGVECNGLEQVQIQLFINEFKSTDLRRDLELVWHSRIPADDGQPPAVSTLYARKGSSQSLFEQAQADIDGNYLNAAASKLKEVVADDPKDFEAWTELGNVQFKAGQWDEARASYGNALDLVPDYLPAVFNLGKLAMVRNDYQQALERLSLAVRLDPKRAEAFYWLGEACLQIKKGTLAVGYFRQALELEPLKMAEAHLRLAALYRAADYPDLALREYELFLQKRPRSPQREAIEALMTECRKRSDSKPSDG